MGSAVWVSHTSQVDWNSVIERLPNVVAKDGEQLVIGEIQDQCLVLRALSAHRYRIVWRDGRFGGDGHLVVYPQPGSRRLTTLDLRLNSPKGLGRLLRRTWHLRATGSRLMTRLAAILEEGETPAPTRGRLGEAPDHQPHRGEAKRLMFAWVRPRASARRVFRLQAE